MAPKIGFAALMMVATISCFISFFAFFYRKHLQQKTQSIVVESIVRNLSWLLVFFAIFSQIMLITSFILSDYSVKNVYQNSHHLKPLIYKIAASWGNHEGSMLLLISVLSLYNIAFLKFVRISHKVKILTSATQNGVIFLFSLYTIIASNPFLRIFPTPNQGLGLNPILQDIGLALHPPMLYTGYLGFSLLFSLAIACLIAEDRSNLSIKIFKKLLSFALGFLTLGIALGSWWAYRELGWGGYWFWDPVENVSLMPWIAGIAMVHAAKLAYQNYKMWLWMMFLATLTMILCLLGIFLTRSGVLNSVHSFAIDANRGLFIIFLIALIGGFGMLVFGIKTAKIAYKNKQKFLSGEIDADYNDQGQGMKNIALNSFRSWLLIANNYFLLFAMLIILVGTIYPILAQGIFNQSITIGAQYYNHVFSILILPFFVFLFLTLRPKFLFFSKENLIFFPLSLLVAWLSFKWFDKKPINIFNYFGLFLAIFCFLLNAAEIFPRKNSRKFIKKTATIAHCGFILSIIGVMMSSYFGSSKELNMMQSQVVSIQKFNLSFDSIDYLVGKNFIARQGVFTLTKNHQKIAELKPELRYFPVSEQTTNESAIYHGLSGDFYVVIGNKDELENYAVRIYHKPFISLIWLGGALIFFALICEFFCFNFFFSSKFKIQKT